MKKEPCKTLPPATVRKTKQPVISAPVLVRHNSDPVTLEVTDAGNFFSKYGKGRSY